MSLPGRKCGGQIPIVPLSALFPVPFKSPQQPNPFPGSVQTHFSVVLDSKESPRNPQGFL